MIQSPGRLLPGRAPGQGPSSAATGCSSAWRSSAGSTPEQVAAGPAAPAGSTPAGVEPRPIAPYFAERRARRRPGSASASTSWTARATCSSPPCAGATSGRPRRRWPSGLAGLGEGWEKEARRAAEAPAGGAGLGRSARRRRARLGGRARLRAEPVRPRGPGAPAGRQRLQAGGLRRGLRRGGGHPGDAAQGLADQRPHRHRSRAGSRRTTTAASAAG